MVWTNNTLFQSGLLQQTKMWMTATEKKGQNDNGGNRQDNRVYKSHRAKLSANQTLTQTYLLKLYLLSFSETSRSLTRRPRLN